MNSKKITRNSIIILSTSVIFLSILSSTVTNVIRADEHINIVNKPKSILPGNIGYFANNTEFMPGDLYQGSIHLQNKDGNVIATGTKIVIFISSEAIDYTTLDFTNNNLTNLFTVTTQPEQSCVILTTKTDIVGKIDVIAPFNGSIIGPEETTFPVGVVTHNTDGTMTDVKINNPEIIVTKKPSHDFGVLNMFWGVSGSEYLNETYLNKNPIDINDIPTGVFSRTTNDIQNFIELNPLKKDVLGDNEHYEITYGINSTKNIGKIKLNNIEVLDEDKDIVIPKSAYQVIQNNNNQISFIFQSPNESGTYPDSTKIIQSRHKYVINITSLATSDSDIYNSNATLNILGKDGISQQEKHFTLNNIFTDRGQSIIFPNITLDAENKSYTVGELTKENILTKVTEGVIAKDTIDGDITTNITTDYKDLLSKKDIVGFYPEQVSYSSTNSLGFNSMKDIGVTIFGKQAAANVTVDYVDEDGEAIADSVILKGFIGENYSSDKKEINGYIFKEINGEPTGTFTDKTKTVTYIYTKNSIANPANVIVDYVDEDGETIADSVILKGFIGENYSSDKKEIDGYIFKEINGEPTGTFTDKTKTVTYIYTKNSIGPLLSLNSKGVPSNSIAISDTHNIGKKQLPNTSDNKMKNFWIVILGLFLLISNTILVLLSKKKY